MLRGYLMIIVPCLILILAVIRWVRYFRNKKKGVPFYYKKWEAIATLILVIAYLVVLFFVK